MNCQLPEKRTLFDGVDSNLWIGVCYCFRYPIKPRTKITMGINRLIDVKHEDAVLRSFILFVQTARAVLKYADAHLYRKTRLSTIKLIVLRVLASNNGVMKPSEIAEWTHTERHNITALIDRMRQEGLVAAERNTSDKRLVNVSLTDKGRQILAQAMPTAREIVNQIMVLVTEDDIVLLERLLRTLRQNAHDGLEHVAKRDKVEPG